MNSIEELTELMIKSYDEGGISNCLAISEKIASNIDYKLLEEISTTIKKALSHITITSRLTAIPIEGLIVLGIVVADYYDDNDYPIDFYQYWSIVFYKKGDVKQTLYMLSNAFKILKQKPQSQQRLLIVDKKIADLVRDHAILQNKDNKWGIALHFFEIAIAINPSDAISWCDMGSILDKLDRIDEAQIALKRSIEIDPEDPITHYNLGLNLFRSGDLGNSRIYLEKAIYLKNDYSRAALKLCEILAIIGEIDKAFSLLSSINLSNLVNDEISQYEYISKKLKSNSHDFQFTQVEPFLAKLLELLGNSDFDGMKLHYKQLNAKNQKKAFWSLLWRANEWLERSRITQTQELFKFIDDLVDEKMLKNQDIWYYWELKGDIQAVLGEFKSALSFYDKALHIDEENTDVLFRKARILAITRQWPLLDQLVKQVEKYPNLVDIKKAIIEQINPTQNIENLFLDNLLDPFSVPLNEENYQKDYKSDIEEILNIKKELLINYMNEQRSEQTPILSIAWFKLALGNVNLIKGEYDSAYHNFTRAKHFFSIAKSEGGHIWAKSKLIELYQQLWRADIASQYTEEVANVLYERQKMSIPFFNGHINAIKALSVFYFNNENKVRTDSLELAIKTMDSYKNKKLLIEIQAKLAFLYFLNRDISNAEQEYKKAIKLGTELNYKFETMMIIVEWMERLCELERWSEIEYFENKVFSVLKQPCSLPFIMRAEYCMAKRHLNSGEVTKAVKILDMLFSKYKNKAIFETNSYHSAYTWLRNSQSVASDLIDCLLEKEDYSSAIEVLESARPGWLGLGKYFVSAKKTSFLKQRLEELDSLTHERNFIVTSDMISIQTKDVNKNIRQIENEIAKVRFEIDMLRGLSKIGNTPIKLSQVFDILNLFKVNWNVIVYWIGLKYQGLFLLTPLNNIQFIPISANDYVKTIYFLKNLLYYTPQIHKKINYKPFVTFIKESANTIAEKLKEVDHVFLIPTGPIFQLPIHKFIKSELKSDSKVPSFSYLTDLTSIRNIRFNSCNDHQINGLLIDNPKVGTQSSNLESEEELLKDLIKLNVLREEEATKGAVREALKHHTIAHFNCHGYISDFAINSGLILSDGILTFDEIIHEEFRLDLVCLSACTSGYLTATISDEVIGLARAFILAGVNSVICTFSEVFDKHARKLMAEFYKNWLIKGLSKSLALTRAVEYLSLSDNSGKSTYENFVLYGSPI